MLGLVVLLSGCALWVRPAPLWQPGQWPLTTYRVTAADEPPLLVAVEATQQALNLVVLTPQGLKLMSATYRNGELEQQRFPLATGSLDARQLLTQWQLAFAPANAVARVYGTQCGWLEREGWRQLDCNGRVRARVKAEGRGWRVAPAGEGGRLWTEVN